MRPSNLLGGAVTMLLSLITRPTMATTVSSGTSSPTSSYDGCSNLLHGKTWQNDHSSRKAICLSRAHRGLSRSLFYTRSSYSTNRTNTNFAKA